jgi:hypothetical protein
MRGQRAVRPPARRFIYATVVLVSVVALFARSPSQTGRNSHIKKPLIYQSGTTVRIDAEGERPLLTALDALREKYGWVVAYEDPEYSPRSDEENASPLPRRRANMGVRGRHLTVAFSVGPTPESRPDEKSVLTTIVDAYNQNEAGQFELREEKDGTFAAVGVGAGGDSPKQLPVLDTLITLPKEPRSGEETIVLICQQMSERSKIAVTPSGIADNPQLRRTVTVGGNAVAARTLLEEVLSSTLSWRLLYDADSRSYGLSLAGGAQ